MIKVIVIALGGLVGLWSGYTVLYEGSLERPKYSVLQKEGPVEIRAYESFRVAQTTRGEGKEELSQGFRVVARYIFGGNEEQKSMSMTVPVIQENQSQGMQVAFVMSEKEKDLPAPSSAAVELKTIQWGRVASIHFSGYGTQKKFKKYEQRLRTWLEKNNQAIDGSAIYAQYNSPSAFPLLRKNEVLLRLGEEKKDDG